MIDIQSSSLAHKIDLAQLRYIVTAADYGSFRRAAEVLNVQLSTLSRSIRQFEYSTSISIFTRSRRGVVPSASGQNVIRIARVVLEQIEAIGFAPRATANSQKRKLDIGFCTSLSTGGLRAAVLDFKDKFPGTQVRTLERPRSRLGLALEIGTLDIIISTGMIPSIKCKSQMLWSERVLIALPEDHRLSGREIIYWTDLQHETLLMSRFDPYWEFENLVTSKLTAAEFRPAIEHHDVSRGILKSLISMRFGLALMLESDIGVKAPNVVYRELQDGSDAVRVGFSAFWEASNENPALAHFLGLLRQRYPATTP